MTAERAGSQAIWEVDWHRMVRRLVLVAVPTFTVAALALYVASGGYGADFHGGVWAAGSDILHGRSPYPPADPHRLRLLLHAFVTPPPLAFLGLPFSSLPFPVAIALWNVMCIAALLLALRVIGVRDVRIYILAAASFPMFDSLQNGQPDALFALAAALTWRYRDSWPGGVAAGALIAAKLLAWPLLIWLLVTRRFRSLAISIGSAVVLLLGSWALIGFKGLADYPSLLAADARAFEDVGTSYSLVHALTPLGLSSHYTSWMAIAAALAIAAAIIAVGRRSDQAWFVGALTFGVLSSPFLWPHYLVVLFVPLALARPQRLSLWIATAYIFWLVLIFVQFSEGRAVAMPLTMSVLVVWATRRRRTKAGQAPAPLETQATTAAEPRVGPALARINWSSP